MEFGEMMGDGHNDGGLDQIWMSGIDNVLLKF